MTTTNNTHAPLTTCTRCNGRGVIRAFLHVANGVCFACGGRPSTSTNAARASRPAVAPVAVATLDECRTRYSAIRAEALAAFGYSGPQFDRLVRSATCEVGAPTTPAAWVDAGGRVLVGLFASRAIASNDGDEGDDTPAGAIRDEEHAMYGDRD